MAPIQRDPLDKHLGAVRTLEAAGVEAPREWAALRQRLLDFFALDVPLRDQLTAAIITGKDPDNIAALRAGAIAEAALPDVLARVNRSVAAPIYDQLCDLYRPHGPKIYTKVAAEFDNAAKLFAGAVDLVDPDVSAEEIVRADEPLRAAWVEAPLHAAQLDSLIAILRTAAELAGANMKDEAVKVGLVIDGQNAKRRDVWEAWRCKEGRTRRWGAIVKTGAVIRAAADIDNLEPYRQARPIEYKIEQKNGLTVTIAHDPETEAESQSRRTA